MKNHITSLVQNVFFVAFASFSASSAHGANSQVPQVGVAVALDRTHINIPTVELYRAVESVLSSSAAWRLVDSKQMLQAMPNRTAVASLGSIVAVDRNQVRAAVDHARSEDKDSSATIVPIQGALESLAIDGSIIVSCDSVDTTSLTACQLLYYDRVLGKVQAAVSKDFKAPVPSAQKWATMLVGNLTAGIQAHRSHKEREELQKLLRAHGDDDEAGQLTALFEVGTRSVSPGASAIRSLPGLRLGAGVQKPVYRVAVSVEQYLGSSSNSEHKSQLMIRGLGLDGATRSRALDSIFWELRIKGAYEVTTAEEGATDAAVSEQNDRVLDMSFSPALVWQVNNTWSLGSSVDYHHAVSLNTERSGVFDQDPVKTSGWGLGLNVMAKL